MKNLLRRKLINFLAKDLYKTITEEDLLKRNSRGRLQVRNIELTKDSEDLLVEQAKALKDSTLWKYVSLDIKHHAIQKSLHKAETMEDVISGKLLLYVIDVIESRLDNLGRGQ